ncbi:MAG: folylpolyglutamate synthase/dihydrofolate synthase family protein [Smithella sp.]|nr:folylpolyglutamate synthase/dihydrofolate synthase family protein [Smithella sp.]
MKSKKINPARYLESLNIHKMRFGLQSVTELLSRLNNPQKSYKTIIIGGTNGKGSTAAMIASLLRSAGYRVGLYTSPHLVDVRERVVINGRKISRKDFYQTIEFVKHKTQKPVTYFEFLTAVAFVYFHEKNVDLAVLEVGLGGRLDATNVCTPLVSVITNIDFDHTAYLGGTLEAIAWEKAGIIKRKGICLTAAKQKVVLNVFQDVCRRRQARLYDLGRDIKIKKQEDGFFTYDGLHRHLKNLKIPLLGEHQASNAALALATIEICEEKGLNIHDTAIRRGLENTRWAARLEVLWENPLFMLDGAHNPAGIKSLCRFLKKDFSCRRLIFIFSALADKDFSSMLKKIASCAHTIILTPLKTERAAPVNEMSTFLIKIGCTPVIAENVTQALEKAFALAGQNDLICAAGSFYLAGETKQAFPKLAVCDNKNHDKITHQR